LPLLFAFIVLIPCVLCSFDVFVSDFSLLALTLLVAVDRSEKKMLTSRGQTFHTTSSILTNNNNNNKDKPVHSDSNEPDNSLGGSSVSRTERTPSPVRLLKISLHRDNGNDQNF
jgi:hypothetical protein